MRIPQTGEQLKLEGIDRVLDNEPENWKELADDLTRNWFSYQQAGREFTGQDLRNFIVEVIGEPHHPNCWGALCRRTFRKWLKAGSIIIYGYDRAKNPPSHDRILIRYRITHQ